MEDLITVQEFANRYRVQTSVIRLWIRLGRIQYKLVGSRKMISCSEIVKEIVPEQLEDEEPTL